MAHQNYKGTMNLWITYKQREISHAGEETSSLALSITPLYVKDLTIHAVLYPQGGLTSISTSAFVFSGSKTAQVNLRLHSYTVIYQQKR